VSNVILYCLAFGALLGGIDHILGNRFGLGQRFEEAFRLLGSIALSMAGILCLAPLLSALLGTVVVPLFRILRFDPGMFGSILAIDMGGYQMSMALAADPMIGRFSGIIVSAIFGCTVVFTIPVGMGAMDADSRPAFTAVSCWALPPCLWALPQAVFCAVSPSVAFFGTACRYLSSPVCFF